MLQQGETVVSDLRFVKVQTLELVQVSAMFEPRVGDLGLSETQLDQPVERLQVVQSAVRDLSIVEVDPLKVGQGSEAREAYVVHRGPFDVELFELLVPSQVNDRSTGDLGPAEP